MLVTLTRKQPEKLFCRSDLCSDCSSAEVMSSATIKYQPSNPLCNHLYLPQFILTALIPELIHVNTACYIVFVLKQWTILSVNKNKMLAKNQTVFIVTVKNSKRYICLYETFVCMKQTRSSRWHPSLIHTDAPKNTSALAGVVFSSGVCKMWSYTEPALQRQLWDFSMLVCRGFVNKTTWQKNAVTCI